MFGLSANSAFGTPNTNNFMVEENVRTQIVAPGDTITFVADSNYKKLTPVWVTFTGANPCLLNGPMNTCRVASGAVQAKAYAFSLCNNQNCNSFIPTKGSILVENPSATSSSVYMALKNNGDINNVVIEGETINWVDHTRHYQDIKFRYLWFPGLGIFNPCSGNNTNHQKTSCTIDIQNNPFESFAYDCQVSCSDPIVHLIRSSGFKGWGLLGLVAAIGLLSLGFLLRNFWPRNTTKN
jgi:hypothetical protein